MSFVLALDFASVTGWAIGHLGAGVHFSGTWDIRPRRGESPGMRYIHLRRKLEEIIAAYPDIILVVYEQAHNRGGAPTEYGHGCVAILQEWCAQRNLNFHPIHSSTLKKFATGKGNANKEAMMGAATARGWRFADDNECDALWLLEYALKEVVA